MTASAHLNNGAFDLSQISDSPRQSAHADVLSRQQLVEPAPVVEQMGRQRRATPAAFLRDGVASAQKGLQIGHGGTIPGKYPELSTGQNPGVAAISISGHIPSMDLPEKLRLKMAERGLNPYSTALKAGLHEDTVRSILRGKVADPGASKLLKLARALETSMEDLLDEEPLASGLTATQIELPVLHQVAAGAWAEMDDLPQEVRRTEVAEKIPAYAKYRQWLEEVSGDSVDRLIPPGSLVHVIDAVELGYHPVDGDIVVVLRTRAGGLLRERSVKQVEVSRTGKVELWPRSHNPRWTSPLVFSDGVREGEEVTAQIVGLVVRSYQRFGRV